MLFTINDSRDWRERGKSSHEAKSESMGESGGWKCKGLEWNAQGKLTSCYIYHGENQLS